MPKRYGIGLNVFLQVILALALFAGVNRLNYYHYWRWDLSPSQDYTLSQATLKYLDSLSRDVQIYIVFGRDSKVYGEVQSLLEEYHLHGRQRIKVRSIDPVRDIERAEQLKADTGLSLAQNGVLIRCGANKRFITEEELVVREKGTSTNKQIIEFRGEDAISSALISVVEGRVRRFYYVVGKGSRSAYEPQSDSFSATIDLGKQQNFEVVQVNLSEVSHIPTDTDGLLILGARYDFSEREIVMLNNYWQTKRAGIFIMLDPGGETPRLNAFLTANGVHPRGDRVLTAESTSTGPKKEFTVLGEFTKDVPFIHHLTSSAITLAGQTESLELLKENTSLKEQSISVKPLILASPRFWGERQFLEELPVVDEEDTLPPIYAAASIERGALGDETQRADSARMVVVSNCSLLDKPTMLAVSRDFAAASVNWLMNRESFIGIPAKSKHSYRIQLTRRQHELIFWVTSITLPGIVLAFGFMVWASRRAA